MGTRPTRIHNRVVTALIELGGFGNVVNIDAETLRARLEDEDGEDERNTVDSMPEV